MRAIADNSLRSEMTSVSDTTGAIKQLESPGDRSISGKQAVATKRQTEALADVGLHVAADHHCWRPQDPEAQAANICPNTPVMAAFNSQRTIDNEHFRGSRFRTANDPKKTDRIPRDRNSDDGENHENPQDTVSQKLSLDRLQ